MTTGNTTLLKLALPTAGELDGTWGDVVNNSITSLVDSAVAGTVTLSADADVTLTDTALVDNQARQAVLLWTASNGATTRNITAPARSKPYIVINAGTGSVVLRGAGPTAGVTVVAGEKCLAAWNSSDFVKIASSVPNVTGPASAVTGSLAAFDGTTGKLLKNASFTAENVLLGNGTGIPKEVAPGTTGNILTSDGTTWKSSPPAGIVGVVPVSNGGTGASTLTANNVLLGNGTSAVQAVAPGTLGNVLTSDGATWASQAPNKTSQIVTVTRTSNTALDATNSNNLINITSGTFTQTFVACATLGSGWFCYLQNSGTGDITLDPNGAETIDGLASYVMYPGEVRLVMCNGTLLRSVVLNPFFAYGSTSKTFYWPPGYASYDSFVIGAGGGGSGASTAGSGANRNGGAGGGAGGVAQAYISSLSVTFGASVSITVGSGGAGGAAGSAGGTGGATSIGALLVANGGGGGANTGTPYAGGSSGGAAGFVASIGTAGGAGGTGSSAGTGTAGGTSSIVWAPTGGGGGGAADLSNVYATTGSAGGSSGTSVSATQLVGGIAGTTAGTKSGGNGSSVVGRRGGTGGGGGAAAASAPGVGGAGVKGGGGGGGGAGVTSAAGGAGGDGYFEIIGVL